MVDGESVANWLEDVFWGRIGLISLNPVLNMNLIWNVGWPPTCDPPVTASWVLRLQTDATTWSSIPAGGQTSWRCTSSPRWLLWLLYPWENAPFPTTPDYHTTFLQASMADRPLRLLGLALLYQCVAALYSGHTMQSPGLWLGVPFAHLLTCMPPPTPTVSGMHSPQNSPFYASTVAYIGV
jgi:hypothetical protein